MPAEEKPVSSEQILLAMAGDRAAVTSIAKAFLPRVYGLCFKLSGNREAAEEATQETFVRALRALPRLEKPESFSAWILMIAANTAREINRQQSAPAPCFLEPVAAAECDANGLEFKKLAIEHAVAALPEEERDLFFLHTLGGMSLESLARHRRTTPGAMKVYMHRIRVKVRRSAVAYLKEHGEDDDKIER